MAITEDNTDFARVVLWLPPAEIRSLLALARKDREQLGPLAEYLERRLELEAELTEAA